MDTKAHEWIGGAADLRRSSFAEFHSCPFMVEINLSHQPLPPRLASGLRAAYQTIMKRCISPMILTCMIVCGSDALGDVDKPVSRKKRGAEQSEASRVGHKIERTFSSVGGHLQKFFTGRDTISR